MKIALTSIASSVLLVGTAYANGGVDVQGAACTPKGSGVYDYAITNTGVTFFGSVTGGVDFYCAIPNAPQMSPPTTFSIQYSDDTGTAGNEIVATYYKMNRSTGALWPIANIYTHSGCSTGNYKTCTATFVDTFDPATYRYFVAITLERTTTAPNEVFWGATVN